MGRGVELTRRIRIGTVSIHTKDLRAITARKYKVVILLPNIHDIVLVFKHGSCVGHKEKIISSFAPSFFSSHGIQFQGS